LLARLGVAAQVRAHVLALALGHPCLRLPPQFAASLRPLLLPLLHEPELDELLACTARELDDPSRWGQLAEGQSPGLTFRSGAHKGLL
jgi:hypothetical protein